MHRWHCLRCRKKHVVIKETFFIMTSWIPLGLVSQRVSKTGFWCPLCCLNSCWRINQYTSSLRHRNARVMSPQSISVSGTWARLEISLNSNQLWPSSLTSTVYPKKYAHSFVVLCFVMVMQSFIMNSHEVIIHIHQGCVAGTGAIVRLPQCQWSKPDGYRKISQCITTTKHSKAVTGCIFLGIYCISTP